MSAEELDVRGAGEWGRLCWVTTMKMTMWVMIGLVGTLGAAQAGVGQEPAGPNYVNENSTDPAPLKLNGLLGRVSGLGGDAISGATVSLFTEEGHRLVASVNSDRDGKFRFDKVEHGLYRVVARVAGLCSANIPVKIESSLIRHHKLEITMRPKDIDTCSYGMAK